MLSRRGESEEIKSWDVGIGKSCQYQQGQGKVVVGNINENYKGKKQSAFRNSTGSALGFNKQFKSSTVSAKTGGASTSTGLKVHKANFKRCFHCQSTDHLRKGCPGFKAWLIKKDNKVFIAFIIVESNMVFIQLLMV